jgi:DNA mismatch repair protein MutL
MGQSRATIRQLPEHLIDQIKAGEVVERPASIVKELVENSIDAEASNVDISIFDNGLELISIEDNGQGISKEELPKAFARHATSKISNFEDLYRLTSFGFRGEALASVASVSRLTCISHPSESPWDGGRINLNGGEVESLSPSSSDQPGTAIYIRDLFYNTPARLKFIRSKASEKTAIKRIVESFVLANPLISFALRFDDKDKTLYTSRPELDSLTRAQELLFPKNESFITFSREYEGVHISGVVGTNASRSPSKRQFLFANRRYFNDKSLHQAIVKGMEGIWFPGENADYSLFIDVPGDEIDVNVHPNKTQIKFQKSAMIFSLITAALREGKGHLAVKPYEEKKEQPETSSYQMRPPLGRILSEENDKPLPATTSCLAPGFFVFNGLIVNAHRVLAKFLSLILSCHHSEDQIQPLMISEPFSLSEEFDRHLDYLNQKGFEFERIDQKTIVLRAIPSLLSPYSLSDILNPFLNSLLSFKGNSEEIIEKILGQKEHFLATSLRIDELEQLIGVLGEDILSDAELAIVPNIQNLLRLFEKS